jgi:two-component system invasion response regulator UvrY
MIRILLVDDHELIREGLKKVLKRHSDFEVVGEASNSDELYTLLEQHAVDIIILDITLPGKDGLDILKELSGRFPKVKTLVLSMHPEERFAVRALKAGAAGYITKDQAASDLAIAIRNIVAGGKHISKFVVEQLVEQVNEQHSKQPHELLSDREFEVFRLIAAGKATSEIADSMSLSVNTVATYRSRILEKMKMNTSAELIRYAVERHLVD